MRKFARDEAGLATLEWVAIAAVCVLAAFGIASFVLQGADATGGSVKTGLDSIAADVRAQTN